jgi:hypothetical protein
MHGQQFSETDIQRSQDLLQKVLARSATDRTFREKLLSDSHAAIAELLGKDPAHIPQQRRVVFVENKAKATIVLPNPLDPDAELSNQELEAVVGGVTPVVSVVTLFSYYFVREAIS